MCQNTAFTFRFFHSFTTNTSTASRSSQLKSTDRFQNPSHNNVCRTPLHTERSLHKKGDKDHRKIHNSDNFLFFLCSERSVWITNSLKPTRCKVSPTAWHCCTPRNASLQPQGSQEHCRQKFISAARSVAAPISGVTGVYHTKKSCLQYVQSTPTPTPRYKNFPPSRIFLIEFSLCPVGLTARGENTWRSFAWFSCGRKRGGASYDTNSQCGRCTPSETMELCRVGYLQGGLVLQLYSQLWTCSGVRFR